MLPIRELLTPGYPPYVSRPYRLGPCRSVRRLSLLSLHLRSLRAYWSTYNQLANPRRHGIGRFDVTACCAASDPPMAIIRAGQDYRTYTCED